MEKELEERLVTALKDIVDGFEKEDLSVRERQIRLWKKLNFLWCGISRVWWSEVAHDWKVYQGDDNGDQGYYDKEINVFRAYLESIIAALSSTVPVIKCAPDDADNPLDILTAKGGTKIAGLVYDHIDAPLLWCKALFIYCTQGMIASYNYTKSSEKYGVVEKGDYEDVDEEIEEKVCPGCGSVLSSSDMELPDQLMAQGEDDILNEPMMGSNMLKCAECQMEVNPEIKKINVTLRKLTGVSDQPKSRQCVEVEGGLFVKVPNYARKQEEIPYLAYCYEQHYSKVLEDFPELIGKQGIETSAAGNDMYEKWGRLSPQYRGEYPENTPTVRNWWLRRSAFNCVKDEDVREELRKKFPNGVKCIWVNDTFVKAEGEDLDEHWTLTYNPLSENIHFDPLGLLLVSAQEITNSLISLTLQTIEHGIPQTFVDPKVLDFNLYKNSQITPGAIFPAKAQSGKALGDGFYTASMAALSSEVEPFGNKIQEMAQFTSGALPSLFGGSQAGSSRTAAQYSMSRNQALQRLQTPWKMINFWWKNTFSKVIPAYIKDMLEDETIVSEKYGSFVNTIVKKSQMDGKIGAITVESAEQIPHSWGQIRDTVMELMQTNNPQILEALGSAPNLDVLSRTLGLTNFKLPGEEDRTKQYEEIRLLMESEPIPGEMDPMTGQMMEMPSVMPEFEVDNHKVEAEICRDWLVGEFGRQAKMENEAGYRNVLLHLKIHTQMLQQLMGGAPQQAGMEQPPQEQEQQLRPIGQ